MDIVSPIEKRLGERIDALTEMGNHGRHQRQGDRHIAAEDMAQRQKDHGAMGLRGQRWIMFNDGGARGKMMAMGD